MKALVVAALLVGGMGAQAESWLDEPSLRAGGGIGSADVDGTQRSTLQLFAGIDTLREGAWRGGIEAGAVDASDSNEDSLWVAGILAWSASTDISLFGRAGLDLGSEAGWMAGAGVGYFIERNMEVRFELAGREQGTGVQFNLAWYPNFSAYP